MINRRGFLAGSVGALALGAVSACGGVGAKTGGTAKKAGAGDTGSLSTQGFGKPDDVGTARINAYKSAYPKVQLKINEGDFDPQQFLSAVASGNPPDVVYLDRELVGTYAAKGAIQPLDDHLDHAGIKTSIYRPAALKEVTVGGKVYGIPEFYDTRNILVNGKALQEAGLTLDDLNTADWDKLHTSAAKLVQGQRRQDLPDRLRPEAAGVPAAVGQGQRRRPRQRRRLAEPRRPEDHRGADVRAESDRRAGRLVEVQGLP